MVRLYGGRRPREVCGTIGAEILSVSDPTLSLERIAVFCGSAFGSEPAYRQAAVELGELLVRRQIVLVYGGGKVGLMGVIADAVMEGGGRVIGVLPQQLRDREVAHFGITQLQVVPNLHERKRLMYKESDAVIAMPGGIGTLDELFEALTWNQLGIHRKPCGLYDVDGYFGPLVEMLRRMEQHQFLRQRLSEMLIVERDPERLVQALAAACVTASR